MGVLSDSKLLGVPIGFWHSVWNGRIWVAFCLGHPDEHRGFCVDDAVDDQKTEAANPLSDFCCIDKTGINGV